MSKKKIEFGDFQTPHDLAEQVCVVLDHIGIKPKSVVEPTCGLGAFVLAGAKIFTDVENIVAVEINANYVATLVNTLRVIKEKRVQVMNDDFFQVDWHKMIQSLPQPVLLLGNPPWVTNSTIGFIDGKNLPVKSNFQQMNGLDAVTGKSNFDISEWMLIRLAKAMVGINGTIAMLCKTTVARKILKYCWKSGITFSNAEIRKIDAKKHFDAGVDACLFICTFGAGMFNDAEEAPECPVYATLDSIEAESIIGYDGEMLIADMEHYERWKHLLTIEATEWRSGVKHDASKVMEFRKEGKQYRNGLDELVSLEEQYLYPLLKSSDVAGDKLPTRWMLITQQKPSDDTQWIQHHAPKTWAYLQAHSKVLDSRGSIIYKKRARFSIFGIGEYTFAPYKVAISGFYNTLKFRVIEPLNGKPVVLDDTIYFLSFRTKAETEQAASALNSEPAQEFLRAFVFWDAKRPITIELLKRLDLKKVADEILV